MMNKIFATIVLSCALAATSLLLGGCRGEDANTTAVLSKGMNTDMYLRTPPDISSAMLEPGYWTSRNASDEPLMTPEEIASANKDTNCPITTPDGQELDLFELQESIDGSFVTALLEGATLPKRPERYSHDGVPTDRAFWEKLKEQEAIERVPDTVPVRFGYSVVWSTLRQFPSRERIATDGDMMYDRLVNTDFRPFEPLAVVHETADGAWLYCLTDGCGGWIERECVALCPSREDWEARLTPREQLVVTGAEITLVDDPQDPQLAGLRLPMGTKLELVALDSELPKTERRIGYGCYLVKVPVRGTDGMIEDHRALIPASDDVHVGPVAYTSKNIIELAFRMIGRPYGWGGDLHATDCSGLIRSVYSCCGLRFPRKADAQEHLAGHASIDLEGKSDEEKLQALRRAPAGSPVFFDGHAMLWLGEAEGHPYVLSSVASFGQDSESIDEVNTVCVNALDGTYRADGSTWLNNLRALVMAEGAAS